MSESYDDGRLDQLVELIVQLSSGDLSARLEPSDARDSLDAVITGINLLAEELELTMEERVAERTIVLEQARIALERMALYDALTGLANRTLLGDRIRQASARAERGARPPCVLVLDLDEFKTVNDGLGHSAGDRILTEVASRLTSVSSSPLLVAASTTLLSTVWISLMPGALGCDVELTVICGSADGAVVGALAWAGAARPTFEPRIMAAAAA